MWKKHHFVSSLLGLLIISCNRPQVDSLVPDTPSSAPDYFCTWNIQGYIRSYPNTSDAMREGMTEENILEPDHIRTGLIFTHPSAATSFSSWTIPGTFPGI